MLSVPTKTDQGPVIYFDVDDTLVMWGRSPKLELDGIWIHTDCREKRGERLFLVPHKAHITKMKAHKEQGATVIVWSRGGGQWAQDVVTALGLTNFVDACIPKPDIAYDDLPATEVLPKTSYMAE